MGEGRAERSEGGSEFQQFCFRAARSGDDPCFGVRGRAGNAGAFVGTKSGSAASQLHPGDSLSPDHAGREQPVMAEHLLPSSWDFLGGLGGVSVL